MLMSYSVLGGRSGCCLPDEVIGFHGLVWNQELEVGRLAVVGRSVRVLGGAESWGHGAAWLCLLHIWLIRIQAALTSVPAYPRHQNSGRSYQAPGQSKKKHGRPRDFFFLTFMLCSFKPTNLWDGSVLNLEMRLIF